MRRLSRAPSSLGIPGSQRLKVREGGGGRGAFLAFGMMASPLDSSVRIPGVGISVQFTSWPRQKNTRRLKVVFLNTSSRLRNKPRYKMPVRPPLPPPPPIPLPPIKALTHAEGAVQGFAFAVPARYDVPILTRHVCRVPSAVENLRAKTVKIVNNIIHRSQVTVYSLQLCCSTYCSSSVRTIPYGLHSGLCFFSK